MPTGRDGRGRWLNNTSQVTVNAAVGGANLLSMSYRRRKRSIRRSRPSLEQDEGLQVTEDNDEGVNGLSKEQDEPIESPEDAEKAAREQENWESFREEHYEVVEQLPLSLQRAYALIRELDQQVHSYNDQLSQSLKSYVDTRNSIAKPVAEAQAVTTDVEEPSADEPGTSSPRRSTRTPAAQSQHSTSNEDNPPSTRELLKRIAQLSEDVMSASYEKLSLARFACDLIDRHNKDLERAIKEQETSLSIGLRPGTHPASIILPDVVVPPATRAPRITHSPIPDDDDYSDQTPAPPDGEAGMDPERELSSAANEKHPRKRSRNRPPKKKGDSVAPSKDKDTPSSPHRPVVRLTLPPLASITGNIGSGGQPDGVIPDDEPRYCYCHGVSAGEMIACDAEGCKYQWFHMECLNMKEAPPGDFICPDCMQSAVPKPVRKRKRR